MTSLINIPLFRYASSSSGSSLSTSACDEDDDGNGRAPSVPAAASAAAAAASGGTMKRKAADAASPAPATPQRRAKRVKRVKRAGSATASPGRVAAAAAPEKVEVVGVPQLSVTVSATADEDAFAAVIVDGAPWELQMRTAGAGGLIKHLSEIEAATGVPVGHVTWIDGDPDDHLLETLNEGVVARKDISVAVRRADRRAAFFDDMRAALSVDKFELKACPFKRQVVKQTLPPRRHMGLTQRGGDVALAVRALEYCMGGVERECGGMARLLPKATHLVIVVADSDMEPVLESVGRMFPDVKVYLAGIAIHNAGQLSRELEAYVDVSRRIFLSGGLLGKEGVNDRE